LELADFGLELAELGGLVLRQGVGRVDLALGFLVQFAQPPALPRPLVGPLRFGRQRALQGGFLARVAAAAAAAALARRVEGPLGVRELDLEGRRALPQRRQLGTRQQS
jgi:hypothetical protein